MNFFFSISNTSIDLTNNGYFEVKAMLMDDNKNYYTRYSDEIEFTKCPKEMIAKYTGE